MDTLTGYTIERGLSRVRDKRKLGCGYTTRDVPVFVLTAPDAKKYTFRLKREAVAQMHHLEAMLAVGLHDRLYSEMVNAAKELEAHRAIARARGFYFSGITQEEEHEDTETNMCLRLADIAVSYTRAKRATLYNA